MGDPKEFSEPDLSQLLGDPAPSPPGETGSRLSGAEARAFQMAHDRLIGLQGVVMVGEGRDEIGNVAVHVGVRTAGDLVHIPKTLHGLPVLTEVIGEVDALPATRPPG